MGAVYRIVIRVDKGVTSWIDDVDLPLLIAHCDSQHLASDIQVSARGPYGAAVAAQWLPSCLPSALPGARRGSLAIAPSAGTALELFVQAAALEKAEAEV